MKVKLYGTVGEVSINLIQEVEDKDIKALISLAMEQVKTLQGKTALDYATDKGYTEVADLLKSLA